jgi:hypothetical protein
VWVAGAVLAVGIAALDRGYDPASVETVRGEVTRVETVEHPGGPGIHLVLRTDGADTLAVAIGPARLVGRRFAIIAGDRVEITGFRVVRGKPTLLATEVKKDGRVLRLRDRHGVPVWRDGPDGRTSRIPASHDRERRPGTNSDPCGTRDC